MRVGARADICRKRGDALSKGCCGVVGTVIAQVSQLGLVAGRGLQSVERNWEVETHLWARVLKCGREKATSEREAAAWW